MKFLSTLFFSFICLNSFAQIPDFFEFSDQDYADHEIFHISSLNDKVLFASYGKTGGTRLTITDSLHNHVNHEFSSYTNYHECKVHSLSNGDTYVHFIKTFDCDYSPPGSYLAKITDSVIEQVQFEETDDLELDRIYTKDVAVIFSDTEDKELLYLLNERFISIYDFEGSFYDTIEIRAEKLFAHENELYYLTRNNKDLVHFSSKEIVFTSDDRIVDAKQFGEELIFINDEIKVFNLSSKEVTGSIDLDGFDLDLDNHNGFYTLRSFSKVGEEVAFIANENNDKNEVFITDFNNGNIAKLYAEDCINFNPYHIHYENDFFHFGLVGKTNVIRRIREMKDYDYNRVNVSFSNPLFYVTSNDTFFISQTTGDTFYTTQNFFNMELDVENRGDQSLLDLAFHSQIEQHPQQTLCEPYQINLLDDVDIASDEIFQIKLNSFFIPEFFDTVYIYMPGANYKLNENCSFDTLVAALPVFTNDISFTESQIKLYPNPVQDFLIFELDESNQVSVAIVDISGQTIVSQQLAFSNEYRIDISGLSNGIYFLKIMTSNKQYVAERFIKN